MPRQPPKELLSLGILTPSVLAEILQCSTPYIRKLCKAGFIKAHNMSMTPGKTEFRIYASDAVEFCRTHLSMKDDQIPALILKAKETQDQLTSRLQADMRSSKKDKHNPNDSGITAELFSGLSSPTPTQEDIFT